jgi:hypothetical protein
MKTNQILGLLVAFFAALAILPTVSATFTTINDITVNGIQHAQSVDSVGVFAGEVIPVRITFVGNADEEDVRVVARILGESGLSEVSERFDVISGKTYSKLLNIALPYDLDDNREETYTLQVTVESNAREGSSVDIELEVQRSSYELEILAVEAESNVRAGETMAVDVVVKNRGRQEAEDTFVMVRVPELGISKRVFLGDLVAVEKDVLPEEFDSEAGRVFVTIPSDAPAGVYDMEVEAFTDDSTTVVQRKVVIVGASEESNIVSSTMSKTFAAGETGSYTLTIVNAGDRIKVYDLVLESVSGLNVEFDESVVAVPAGTSKTVKMNVMSSNEGTYNFAVNVHSDGELVKKQSFVANVEGSSRAVGGNSAVLLTVVLAIIFVVLLIVLIVLLTRRPEKSEDSSESYY